MIRICYDTVACHYIIGDLSSHEASYTWHDFYLDAVPEFHRNKREYPTHSVFIPYQRYIYIDVPPDTNLELVPELYPELFI